MSNWSDRFSAYALDGRRALLVGAAGGIGAACARRFADLGAELVLVDREAKALDGILPGRAGVDRIVCDVADPAGLRHMLGEAGRVDILSRRKAACTRW